MPTPEEVFMEEMTRRLEAMRLGRLGRRENGRTYQMPRITGNAANNAAEKAYVNFVARTQNSLSNSLRVQFQVMLGYFAVKCENSIKTSNFWEWYDAEFIYHLRFESENPLLIQHKKSGIQKVGSACSFEALKLSFGASARVNDPLYCHDCARNHIRYGMEVEFCLGTQDNTYKEVFLRKANEKIGVNPMADAIGLDGSRVPFEIRNVNGNSPKELYDELMKKIVRVKETHIWMRKNLPGASANFNIDNCGTHIHYYHPKISRDRVNAAFTAISIIINDFDSETWQSRLNRNYGQPFVCRGVDWCHSEYATELRVLNAIHPLMILFCIESMEECLTRNKGVVDDAAMLGFLDKYMGGGVMTRPRDGRQWGRFPEHINQAVAFFIKKQVIRPIQVNNMIRWLRKNYRPLKDAVINTR